MIKYFFCFLLSAHFAVGAQFERHDIPIQTQLVNCLRQVPLYAPYTPPFIALQNQIHGCIDNGANLNAPSQYFFIPGHSHAEGDQPRDPLRSASLPWIRAFNAWGGTPPENHSHVDDRLLSFFQWATSLHQGQRRIDLSSVSAQVSSLFLQDLLTNYSAIQTVSYLVNEGINICGSNENCPLLTFLCSNASSFCKTPHHFHIFKNLCTSIIFRITSIYTSNHNFYYVGRLNDRYLDSFLENYAQERICFQQTIPIFDEALFFQKHPYISYFYIFLKSHGLGNRL